MTRIKHLLNEINYELVRRLAEGGMGEVYEARQNGIDHFSKTVAIKLIREEYSAIKEFRRNFVGEGKTGSRFNPYQYRANLPSWGNRGAVFYRNGICKRHQS